MGALLAQPGLAYADEPSAAENPFAAVLTAEVEQRKEVTWDVYLSGYAYHDRDTYSRNQLRKMNENTWGGGFGRTRRTERGNDESFYVLGIKDSNERPQWMAGYAYQWIFPMMRDKAELGVGVTGLLIRRHDWFEGRPFPALLPMASIGGRNTQLIATYVPRLSVRKAKGNIVLLMFRMSL
ncbi:hypothetical protein [Massilia niastensis]|uniref:hypothetical protein n=1 Tax=Massilia niastensis TaxID=544911 RepID=UPI0003735052|nr:hypothetical protein [Massilia niastensis]